MFKWFHENLLISNDYFQLGENYYDCESDLLRIAKNQELGPRMWTHSLGDNQSWIISVQ